jgi:hypothetical protein
MQREYEWENLPLIKITNKDKELARMILSGINKEEKSTRGFLFYNVIEEDFIMKDNYVKFLELLDRYLKDHWNISNWDEEVKSLTKEDLEWYPHLSAYKYMSQRKSKIEKIA